MATSRKSPDYDPIEEALDLGYGLGREQEKSKSTDTARAAARSGRRKAQATERKAQSAERSQRHQRTTAEQRRRREAREAEVARARRGAYRAGQAANRQVAKDTELAAARRGAYRSGQVDARRQAVTPRPRSGAGVTGSGASTSLSVPNFRPPGFAGGRIDRTTSSRIIIVAIAASTLGVVYRDVISGQTPDKTTVDLGNGEKLVVPTHLRSFAGVFIAGTVALVVNEFSPELGLIMGLVLLFDVGASTLGGRGGLFERLGGGFMAKGGSQMQPAKPGQGGVPWDPTIKDPKTPSSGRSGLGKGPAGVGGGSGSGGGGSWP